MNIELFVSPKGHVVLTCHGAFEKTIDHIQLNTQTGLLTFVFKPDMSEWQPNCAVDQGICMQVKNQLFCALGYFKDKKLTASEYVHFKCV